MTAPNQMTPQQAAQAAADANNLARALITSRSVKMTQNIYSNTINPQNQQAIQVPIRPVGLVLGFWLDFNFSVADPGAGNTYDLTAFGPANALYQVQLLDLNNNTRIQTAGWHLHFLNTAKKRRPFCAVNTLTTYPIGYGNNWTTAFAATTQITHAGFATQNVYMRYWLPVAYSDFDLRGSMYMNVVNATAQINIQIASSAQAFVAAGADATLAVYQGSGGAPVSGWGTTCVINVYQVYYDQLPTTQEGQVLLPYGDMSAIYDIKSPGAYTGMVSGQDFPVTYANFRDFLSTTVVWNNGGTLDTGQFTNFWALQSANFTNIFKVSPNLQAIFARNEIGDDFPKGVYYFPTRDKPISTVQYGNMQLVLNANGVIAAGAQLLVGYESFALVNTLVGAASLQTAA